MGKIKLNKQERKDILKEVEKSSQEEIIDTSWENELDKLVLFTHRLYNHLNTYEQKDLKDIVRSYDGLIITKVILKTLNKLEK
jgi:hypothetical protein